MQSSQDSKPLSVSIIGTGYVGLVTGVTFAHHGVRTICIDVDSTKVDMINRKETPIFETGLEPLLERAIDKGLLSATTDFHRIRETDVTFICVGTPSLPDGSVDLSAVEAAAGSIGEAIREKDGYHVVGTKSTVIPGTTEGLVLPIVEEHSGKKVGEDFGLVMIPEFLRQGQAVYDALHPNRIIIGEHDKRAGKVIHRLYDDHRHENGDYIPFLHVEIKAAELIKYAANSLLATKITFANEFARICEKFNIDAYEVMTGVGMDFRINPRFLNAGCGFGGSCFPKDVNAITALAKDIGVETPLMDAVLKTNEIQPLHLVDIARETVGEVLGDVEDGTVQDMNGEDGIRGKIGEELGARSSDVLRGKTVAFLGLAFKPDTDDTRATRALPIIQKLHEEGAEIKAYDPKAVERFKELTDIPIQYMDSWEDALRDADFAVIQTDWQEIKEISPLTFKRLMRTPIIIDGRRTYNPERFEGTGITYRGIGWKNSD